MRPHSPTMAPRERLRFDPSGYPADFSDEIRELWDREGDPCEPFPSGHRCPDYGSLDGPSMRYYLWWRTCVRHGTIPMYDEGYAWLYCREIIDMGGEPQDVVDRLRAFEDLCRGDYRLRLETSGVADEYALYAGLPLRSLRFDGLNLIDAGNAVALSTYPISRTTASPILEFDWYRYTADLDESDMREIIHLTLRGIDEITRSKGVPLVEAIGCDIESSNFMPLTRFGRDDRTVDLPTLDRSDAALSDIADSIARMATRFVTGDTRTPRVPSSFPEEYRRVVACAVDSVVRGEEFLPESFRTGPPGSGFWGDSRVIDIGAPRLDEPVVARQTRAPFTRPWISTDDILAHRDDVPDPDAPYVPSHSRKATYRQMDRRQTAFYIRWRTEVLSGRYGYTDEGYMWLLLTELINLEEDPERTRAVLEGMRRAYGDQAPMSMMDVVRSHALANGYDVPPGVHTSPTSRHILASIKLESRPVGAFDMLLIRMFTDYGSKYVDRSPAIYEEAFTEAIRAVDDLLESSDGRRIFHRGGKRSYVGAIPLYESIWLPEVKLLTVQYRRVTESARVADIVDSVFRVTIRTVNARLGRSGPKVPKGMRTDMVAAVVDAVDAYMDRREGRERMARARAMAESMSFDDDAVRRAEEDLHAVTGMMSAGDGIPDDGQIGFETVPEPAPPIDPEPVLESGPRDYGGDPWSAFASALDATERRFLAEKLAGGDGSAALVGTGMRPVQVESSVNSKAMDAIGDAVMEDGIIFEEYLDELRGALRWRSPGAPSSP